MPRLSEALQLPRLVVARKYGVSTDAVRRRRDDFDM
jgi:hypothetical protein